MTVYLRHREASGCGFAEYDPRRNMFRCPTCNLKEPAAELRRPCPSDGCAGVLHFDAPSEELVCGRNPGHRFGPDDGRLT